MPTTLSTACSRWYGTLAGLVGAEILGPGTFNSLTFLCEMGNELYIVRDKEIEYGRERGREGGKERGKERRKREGRKGEREREMK